MIRGRCFLTTTIRVVVVAGWMIVVRHAASTSSNQTSTVVVDVIKDSACVNHNIDDSCGSEMHSILQQEPTIALHKYVTM